MTAEEIHLKQNNLHIQRDKAMAWSQFAYFKETDKNKYYAVLLLDYVVSCWSMLFKDEQGIHVRYLR